MNINITKILGNRLNDATLPVGLYYTAADPGVAGSSLSITVQLVESGTPVTYWMPAGWTPDAPVPAYEVTEEPEKAAPQQPVIASGTVERLLAIALHSSVAEKLIK
jgi:hypothetical protein